MNSPSFRDPHIAARRGFALVCCLSLLALLLLLAVGITVLGSKSVKDNSKNAAEMEARANARLALMMAIGELQAQLGPDQRVSASLGILDENPNTPAIDGVAEPHWTAVWSTEWPGTSNNPTPWVRDNESGGLRDRRFENGYDRKEQLRSILVSGNEGGAVTRELIEHLDLGAGPNAVRLVGPGSVLRSSQEVEAPMVETGSGAYAFWVGDLGVKAHVKLVDAYDHLPLGNKREPAGMERMVNAQDVEAGLVAGLAPLDKGEKRRLVSDRSIALTRKNKKSGVKQAYHDVTTWSRAVLANTRDGGLQRDLTAYLHSSGSIPDLEDDGEVVSWGLQDLDNMIGPANSQRASWRDSRYQDIAPRFGMLRRWARGVWRRSDFPEHPAFQAQRMGAKLPETLQPNHPIVRAMQDNTNVYEYGNQSPVSFLPLDTPNVAPVLVEGSIYYNIAAYPQVPNRPDTDYVVRMGLYPRVALWNPYNIELELDTMVAQLFVNGNKRIRVRGGAAVGELDLPIGRGSPNNALATGNRWPAHYQGNLLFTILPATLGPGETLVFTPDRAAAYEHENIFRNTLTPAQPPSPDLYYWDDMDRVPGGVLDFAPLFWVEWPEAGTASGAEHYLMALKDAGRRSPARARPTDNIFNFLPLIVYANTSLRAGAGSELPVTWNSNREIPVQFLATSRDILPATAIPDVRTRDGFRLRWWREHSSNIRGSGQLFSHPRHFEGAAVANWNPRAAYFCRTPFDNVTDLPPNFFGVYTRDLFDPEVSWEAMMPRSLNRGNPFGPPVEGPDRLVLFEVPRREIGIPSLGFLRHLKLSEFGWAPSYAVGNSLADPRVGRTGTVPRLDSQDEQASFGWNLHLFGWDELLPDYWAQLFREILFNYSQTHQVVHDLSYEANHTLWDDYFLSTGDAIRKRAFLKSGGGKPLPNGRFSLYDLGDNPEAALNDFHRAASRLMLEGGFNVHSISKEAWKAVLASTIDTEYSESGGVAFPRVLSPAAGEWRVGSPDADEAMAGFRSLSEAEIDALADQLVREVKERAPFFGLGDFINRRLEDSTYGEKGPVEAAIAAAGLNEAFDAAYPLDNTRSLPDVSFFNMRDTTRLEQTLKPDSVAWGIPGYLTQGDVVQVLGSTLRPRSDTFVVRAYGESRDAGGKVQARAWCEAIVQRTPDPLNPDATGLNPRDSSSDQGRRFEQVSFRWLREDEL